MPRIILILGLVIALGSVSGAKSLEEYLTQKIMTDHNLDSDDAAITLFRSGLSTVDIDNLEVKAYPLTQAEPKGRYPIRIELYRDGQMIERGRVSMDVRRFKEVLVPVQNITRHQHMTAEMFAPERIDITSITEDILTDPQQVMGFRAKSNLTAGRYVSLKRIEQIPDAEIGQPVTIVTGDGLFEIRAKGLALENGLIGEMIKVKNVDTRKILSGTVAAPGVVEVAL